MGMNHSKYDFADEMSATYCEQNRQNERQEREKKEVSADSLDMAKRERDGQGSCEVEIRYGGEADLHSHWNSCEKCPGHLNFKPVQLFDIDFLPIPYQDSDLVDLVRALADLTVRVDVRYVSDKRPQTYPGSDNPFPCYNDRGINLLRTGTGWVYLVKRFSGKKKKKFCTCGECIFSSEPKRQFAHIVLKTAAHVVFDNYEGAHTSCHLFFDTGATPGKSSDVITLSKMSHVVSDAASDTCQMTYVTHDMDLANRLTGLWRQRRAAHERVLAKYDNDSRARIKNCARSEHTLTIIASHPHGCSKQISLGDYSNRELVSSVISQYIYSTPTCPGSSGALVYVVGNSKLLFDHGHCGTLGADKKLNYSTYGLD